MGRPILLACLSALLGAPCVIEVRPPDEGSAAGMGAIVRASAPGENILQIWAYADPKDGRYLMACGMLSSPPANASYGYVYSSSDAGATWRRTLLDDATSWVSEESCTYGQDGRAYFVDGQSETSTGLPRHEWGRMQVFRSEDHGMTWKPAGRREFVDWTMLVALPSDKDHAESLVIFGNTTADKVGRWWEKRPLALEVTDGATTFSPPVAPPINSVGNFGVGSVALRDRTALFVLATTDLKNASTPGKHRQVNLFAYRPSDRSLNVRATLRKKSGRIIGLPSLVRDTSRQFQGRLYAAWSENARSGSDAQLWLAISDDNGYHWSSRPILSMGDYRTPKGCPTDLLSVPPDLRIALTPVGMLGVLWKRDAQTLLFAVSTDGGQTFQPGQLVVRQPTGELSVDEGVPFNEWWLGESLAVRQNKSISTFADLSHLGLSVRLSKHNGIGDFALTADPNNRFHAFWAGAGNDGNYALMTRAIDATSAAGPTNSALANAPGPSICGDDSARLRVEWPSPTLPLEIAGQTDISTSLSLRVDHVDYVADSHTVRASVILMNKSMSTLRGPLSLFGVGLHSDFGVATPLNASGTTEGQPFWNISAAIPADGLAPNGSSKPVQLEFKIDQFRSVPTGDVVAMQVRVFTE